MEDRRETRFKVDQAVTAQVLDLFKGDTLQCFFRLHDRDGVCEAFEIFGETTLVRALMEPLGKGLRIVGGSFKYFALFASSVTVSGRSTPSRCSCRSTFGNFLSSVLSSFIECSAPAGDQRPFGGTRSL